MKTRNLADLVELEPHTWRDIAERMVESIRNTVQREHYFSGKPYKPEYAEKKAQNRALTGGATQASTSTVPDLTLTGKMMGDLRVISADERQCIIGWFGTNAVKVESNARYGRAITTKKQPLLPPVLAEVLKDIDRAFGASVDSYRAATKVKINL